MVLWYYCKFVKFFIYVPNVDAFAHRNAVSLSLNHFYDLYVSTELNTLYNTKYLIQWAETLVQ